MIVAEHTIETEVLIKKGPVDSRKGEMEVMTLLVSGTCEAWPVYNGIRTTYAFSGFCIYMSIIHPNLRYFQWCVHNYCLK